jgi:acetolactate synthase-1/2/3 large subunit
MTKVSGAAYIADAFQAYGVTHFFHVPVIMPGAMKALIRRGLMPVVTHGEKAAVYMADGYARVSGRVGACGAQAVGAANLAAGLRDPFLAHSPVLAITGGREPLSKYRGLYQEIEDYPLYAEVTKFNAQVDLPERIPDLLRQAFRAATSGAAGPVHLEFSHHAGNTVDAEIDADPTFESTFARVPAFRVPADDQRIQAVIEALAAAERPVIVAGGGVAWSDASRELVRFAERFSIPVATSLNGRGVIPDIHPLALGAVGHYSVESANRAVCAADLVVFIGTSTGGLTTKNWQVPPAGTRVIQIDVNPEELGRNYPNTVAVCGDARTVLEQLLAHGPAPSPARTGWLQQTSEFVTAWQEKMRPLRDSQAVPMRPERLCRDLSDALPEHGIAVFDTGHAAAWAAQGLRITLATQRVIRAHGSLGWAFPAAIGAKCAAPDRPVVCFTGDGGFYYHIAELETAVRYQIPVVIVVNNNASLNQEAYLWGGDPAFAKNWRFERVNFAQVAEAFGCAGFRAERPEEIAPTIRAALMAGRPAVVDVITDDRAISVPGWVPGA